MRRSYNIASKLKPVTKGVTEKLMHNMQLIAHVYEYYSHSYRNTINIERFARLDFHGFWGFEEYHEFFSVNI